MSDQHIDEIDKKLIAGHEYDGIRELDNPLPKWWQATFYGTIIFAAGYWFFYHMSTNGLPTSEELKGDLAAIEAVRAKNAPATPPSDDLDQLIGNPAAIAAGKGEFEARCVACHGPDGGGQIGPNLTDNYWIHGQGKPADILQVVTKGVPDKGMIAWETMMNVDQIKNVVAYVASLKGTTPKTPKAPDGVEVKEQ